MSHEVNRYEWEQMCANLAAKDVKVRELRGFLSGIDLHLESETMELCDQLEIERIHRRKPG